MHTEGVAKKSTRPDEGEAANVADAASTLVPTEGEKRENRIATWVAIVGGIVGIPVAVAGFYFLVFPRPEGCPGSRLGDLGQPTVDAGVNYREYLRITSQPTTGLDPQALARLGTVIDIPVTAAGYRGKSLSLRWTVLTATGSPVGQSKLNDQLAQEITPEDCSDRGRRKIWAAWPHREGRYVVEVAMRDENDELLDTQRTAAFAVPGV
jgi:hypothetical protein